MSTENPTTPTAISPETLPDQLVALAKHLRQHPGFPLLYMVAGDSPKALEMRVMSSRAYEPERALLAAAVTLTDPSWTAQWITAEAREDGYWYVQLHGYMGAMRVLINGSAASGLESASELCNWLASEVDHRTVSA